MIREQIDNRIACNYIIEPHRKINLLSINFITPITEGNYTIKSILPLSFVKVVRSFQVIKNWQFICMIFMVLI